MITFLRILKAGLINFIRNGVLSFASTTIMVLTLLTLSSFFITNIALGSYIKEIQAKIDVSAYLNDDIDDKKVIELQKRLADLSEVRTVKYVSKMEAMDRYRRRYANNKTILESLEGIENPLPASLEIKVWDPAKLDQVTKTLEEPEVKPLVHKISYKENKQSIDKLVRVTNLIKKIGIVATTAFGIVTIIIVFNTIRIAIFSQKDDIEIMKLVGATNWYIRGPFVIEGALYGLIATVISTIALATVFYYSGPGIFNYFGSIGSEISNYLYRNTLLIFGIQLLLGSGIGTISSFLALRKYLKSN